MTNNPPRINELAHSKLLLLILFAMTMLVVCVLYLASMWHNLDAAVRFTAIILFSLSGVTSLAVVVRLLFCRVHINENGADADNLFGNTAMVWEDIRTAAIVRLSINGQKSDSFIVLSTREPQVVLNYRALTTKKVLAPEEIIRIPATGKRQKAVEHYLHMTLPEFTL